MTGTSFQNRLGFAPAEAIKAPCAVVAIANVTLSGEQTINTVAVTAGDRVLVTAQDTTTEHGIWNVAVSSWTRATDWNDAQDVVNGQLASVPGGIYQASFTGDYTPDTTVVTFAQIFGTSETTVSVVWEAATIASGAITLTTSQHSRIVKIRLTSESGSSDTLSTITGGLDGDIVIFKPIGNHDITIDDSGNIRNTANDEAQGTPSSKSIILNSDEAIVWYVFSDDVNQWLTQTTIPFSPS